MQPSNNKRASIFVTKVNAKLPALVLSTMLFSVLPFSNAIGAEIETELGKAIAELTKAIGSMGNAEAAENASNTEATKAVSEKKMDTTTDTASKTEMPQISAQTYADSSKDSSEMKQASDDINKATAELIKVSKMLEKMVKAKGHGQKGMGHGVHHGKMDAKHGKHKKKSKFKIKGDVRTGFFGKVRDDKGKADNYGSDLRLRARYRISHPLSENLTAKIGFAGRWSTAAGARNNFSVLKNLPNKGLGKGSASGLSAGTGTIDQLYLEYKPSKNYSLRAGRFLTKMKLKGVAGKSLDRNNSSNTNINWTDGVYSKIRMGNWKLHVGLDWNPKQGTTAVKHAPLDFTDDDARVSLFLALDSKAKAGAFIQRSFDLNYLPNALCKDGTCTKRSDYIGLVGRAAMQWDMDKSVGRKFVWGFEFGFAPETQNQSLIDKTTGDADGFAFQTSFNFLNMAPKHHLGILIGAAGGGWLISNDFRNNNLLLETRYQWKISKTESIEIRLRQRTELDETSKDRVDTDMYARYTYKFKY